MDNYLAFTADDIDTIAAGSGGASITSIGDILNGSVGGLGLVALFFFIAGALFVIYLIYGGIKLMTSAGEPRSVAEARQVIMNALIGLLVVIFSFWIVQFVGLFLGLPSVLSTFT